MSLRSRLLLAVGAVALVALLVADVATYYSLRSSLFDRVDQTLAVTQHAVERATATSQPQLPDTLMNIAPGTFVQVRTAAGTPLSGQVQPAAMPGGTTYTPKLPATIEGLAAATPPTAPPSPGTGVPPGEPPGVYFTTSAVESGGPHFRVRASLLPGGQQLIVATPLGNTFATLNRLLVVEALVTVAALAAAMLLGWWLVRVGLKPLADVETTAEAIAAGELDQRVPGENPRTEVGRLATVLNTMLGRIQTAFAERDATEAELRESEDHMRRFVADASHELRTPLAAVSAYAELLDSGAVRDEKDMTRVVGSIRDETARMGTLVQDLLLLARLDEGRPMACEPTELVSLVADVVHTATTLGPGWPVSLQADEPVEVCGDREKLRQVVANLLGNVRAHTPEGTAAVVTLRRDADAAVIEVADAGPGLTDEQAGRVFERFYRADPSRSRARGGAGLGLSIVAAIVAAHGGSVSAAPATGGGAMFTVRLPRFSDEAEGGAASGQREDAGQPTLC
jgi:two-component system, OmpR family, sensor kinase